MNGTSFARSKAKAFPGAGRPGACGDHRAGPFSLQRGGRTGSLPANPPFYTHKATEKLFEHLPVTHGVRLAESISGDSSFAHATAFCHAVERAAEVVAPPRGQALRTVCLELERIYNHMADIGAIATDVAFVVANAHAMRFKEKVLRLNEVLTGNRLLRGMACLGGVRYDWAAPQLQAIAQLLAELKPEFDSLGELIQTSSSTRDGSRKQAFSRPRPRRTSALLDWRAAPPDLTTTCAAIFRTRLMTRFNSAFRSIRRATCCIGWSCASMKSGNRFPSSNRFSPSCRPGRCRSLWASCPLTRWGWATWKAGAERFFHWIRTRPGNRLARCKVKDPSLQNWPALCEAIQGNIIPDFPVVNKSFNLSYSGTDR